MYDRKTIYRHKSDPASVETFGAGTSCRRRWGRYPIRPAQVDVSTTEHEFKATTIDESIGGLGLLTSNSASLFPGQSISIAYRNEQTDGIVASVFKSREGARRFSVRWGRDGSASDTSKEQPFVVVDNFVVACQLISDEGERPARIRLWNGDEFQVAAKRLVFRTMTARRRELCANKGVAAMLAKLYGAESRLGTKNLVDGILDFEFAAAVV